MTFRQHSQQQQEQDPSRALSDACVRLRSLILRSGEEDGNASDSVPSSLLQHIEAALMPRFLTSFSDLTTALQLFPPSSDTVASAAGFNLGDPTIRKRVQETRCELESFRSDATLLWNAVDEAEQQQQQDSTTHHLSLCRTRVIAAELAVASLPKPCQLWRDAGILSASALLEAAWMMTKTADAVIDMLRRRNKSDGDEDDDQALPLLLFLAQRADQFLQRVWSLAAAATPALNSARSSLSEVAKERLFHLACDAAGSAVELMLLAPSSSSSASSSIQQQQQQQNNQSQRAMMDRCGAHICASVEAMARTFPAACTAAFVERAAHAVIASKGRVAAAVQHAAQHQQQQHQLLRSHIALCCAMSKQVQPFVSSQRGAGFCLLGAKLSLTTAEDYFLGAKSTRAASPLAAQSGVDGAAAAAASAALGAGGDDEAEKTSLLSEALSFATAAEVQCRHASVAPSSSASSSGGASDGFSVERIAAHVFQLRARVHVEMRSHADALAALTSLLDVAESAIVAPPPSINSSTSKGANSCKPPPAATSTPRFVSESVAQCAIGVHRVCTDVVEGGGRQRAEMLSRGLALLLRVQQHQDKSKQHRIDGDAEQQQHTQQLLVYWLSRLLSCFQQQQQNQYQLNRALVGSVLTRLQQSATDIEARLSARNCDPLGADAAIKIATGHHDDSDERQAQEDEAHALLEDLARNFSLLWATAQRGLDDLSGAKEASSSSSSSSSSSPPALDAEIVLHLLRLASQYAIGCGVEQRCIALRALARAQLLLAADVAAAMHSLDAAQALMPSSPHTALLRFQLHLVAHQQQQNHTGQQPIDAIESALRTDLECMSRGRLCDAGEALSIAAQLSREAGLPAVCAAALQRMIGLGGEPLRLLSMLRSWAECHESSNNNDSNNGGGGNTLAEWIWCAETAAHLLSKAIAQRNDVAALAMWWAVTLVKRAATFSGEQDEEEQSRESSRLCSAAVDICRRTLDGWIDDGDKNETIDDDDENRSQQRRAVSVDGGGDEAGRSKATAVTQADLHRVLRWAALEYIARLSDCFDLLGKTNHDDASNSNTRPAAAAAATAMSALMACQEHISAALATIRAVKRSMLEERAANISLPADTQQLWQQLVAAEFVCVVAQYRGGDSNSAAFNETSSSLSTLVREISNASGGDDAEFLLGQGLLLAAIAKIAADSRFHAVALEAVDSGVFCTVEELAAMSMNSNATAAALEQQLRGLFLFSTSMHDALDSACATRGQQLRFAQSAAQRASQLSDAVFGRVADFVAAVKQSENDAEHLGDHDDDGADAAPSAAATATASAVCEQRRADVATLQGLLASVAASLRAVICQLWNAAVFDVNLGDMQHATQFVDAALRVIGEILKTAHRLAKACAAVLQQHSGSNNSSSSSFSAHVGFVEVLLAQFQAASASAGVANATGVAAEETSVAQLDDGICQQSQKQHCSRQSSRAGSLAAH